MTPPAPVVLRAAGASLVLDVSGGLLPRILHWGRDLGPATDAEPSLSALLTPPVPRSAFDEPAPFTLVPTEDDGWSGTPGLEVHTGGGRTAPRLRLTEPVTVEAAGGSGGIVTVTASDPVAGVVVRQRLRLDARGVLRSGLMLTAIGNAVVDVAALRTLVPLPGRAAEVLDLTGRWCRERSPQRSTLQQGTHLRASRRGRTGHDATLLMCAGTAGFGFRHGEVWAAHVAWSGDHEHLVEALPEGAGAHAAVLGGGELLRAGEVRLAPGETYTAPDVVLVWSGSGLDGLSQRLHASLRDRPHHPSTPRPLVLNSWEALYFSTDTAAMLRLADAAAAIGVERFVVDDGWFGSRRDDTRGLGDWVVSTEVWPDGLHPLVAHVRSLGMQFGLWFEPEMVNLDSDLVRAHPDWVLGPRQDDPARPLPRSWRHQQVLDLVNPDAWEHLLERIDALVTEYGIDFVKWDHNRDLHQAVHSPEHPSEGLVAPDHPAVHDQTSAFYALLDELRRRHPGLEVESCASGGGRVDHGVLERTDRVWASDTNDALERQLVQRWTGLLLPPELVGGHVGPPVAHTTGRTADLSMRCATALFGHAGLEWDITTCTPEETAALRAWSGLYRELRPLLHSGDVVRADLPEAVLLHGVVAADGSAAVFAFVQLQTSPAARPGAVRLPGLPGHRRYLLRVRQEAGPPVVVQAAPPGWWDRATGDGVEASGAVLGELGLQMPVLAPGQALVLHLTAVG